MKILLGLLLLGTLSAASPDSPKENLGTAQVQGTDEYDAEEFDERYRRSEGKASYLRTDESTAQVQVEDGHNEEAYARKNESVAQVQIEAGDSEEAHARIHESKAQVEAEIEDREEVHDKVPRGSSAVARVLQSNMCKSKSDIAGEAKKNLDFINTLTGLVGTLYSSTAAATYFSHLGTGLSTVMFGITIFQELVKSNKPICHYTMDVAIDEAITAALEERDVQYALDLEKDYSWVEETTAIYNPHLDGTPIETLSSIASDVRQLIRTMDKNDRLYYGGKLLVLMTYELMSLALAISFRYTADGEDALSRSKCDKVLLQLSVDLHHITHDIIQQAMDKFSADMDDAGSEKQTDIDSCTQNYLPVTPQDGGNNGKIVTIKFMNPKKLGTIPAYRSECKSVYKLDLTKLKYDTRLEALDDYLPTLRREKIDIFWSLFSEHDEFFRDLSDRLRNDNYRHEFCRPLKTTNFTPQKIKIQDDNLVGTIMEPGKNYIISFVLKRLGRHQASYQSLIKFTAAGNKRGEFGDKAPELIVINDFNRIWMFNDVQTGTSHKQIYPSFPHDDENEIKIIADEEGINVIINGVKKYTFEVASNLRPLHNKLDVYVGTKDRIPANAEVKNLKFAHAGIPPADFNPVNTGPTTSVFLSGQPGSCEGASSRLNLGTAMTRSECIQKCNKYYEDNNSSVRSNISGCQRDVDGGTTKCYVYDSTSNKASYVDRQYHNYTCWLRKGVFGPIQLGWCVKSNGTFQGMKGNRLSLPLALDSRHRTGCLKACTDWYNKNPSKRNQISGCQYNDSVQLCYLYANADHVADHGQGSSTSACWIK